MQPRADISEGSAHNLRETIHACIHAYHARARHRRRHVRRSFRPELGHCRTPYPDGNFHTINISQFADDVRAATDGGLDITLHSAGSLIRHPEIKRSIRSGIVPIGEGAGLAACQ